MAKELKKEKLACYTVGHSSHKTEDFINLLKDHDIRCIADVRSSPYSKYAPQFNRELLKKDLENSAIEYIYMGNCLGARYTDPSLFFDDKQMVDFEKVSKTVVFRQGVNQVIEKLNNGFKLALMCAEKDPFDCHRFMLVSHFLSKKGIQMQHIREDGHLESNDDLEQRLLNKYKINNQQAALFEETKTKKQAIEKAYIARNKDIGYKIIENAPCMKNATRRSVSYAKKHLSFLATTNPFLNVIT